jgi:hypothetical protein
MVGHHSFSLVVIGSGITFTASLMIRRYHTSPIQHISGNFWQETPLLTELRNPKMRGGKCGICYTQR